MFVEKLIIKNKKNIVIKKLPKDTTVFFKIFM